MKWIMVGDKHYPYYALIDESKTSHDSESIILLNDLLYIPGRGCKDITDEEYLYIFYNPDLFYMENLL